MGQAGDRVTVGLRHDNLSPRRKDERPFALRSQMRSTREESYFCLLVYSSESGARLPARYPPACLTSTRRACCASQSRVQDSECYKH